MPAGLKCPCHGIILDGTHKTCCLLAQFQKTRYKNKINILTENYIGGGDDLDGQSIIAKTTNNKAEPGRGKKIIK